MKQSFDMAYGHYQISLRRHYPDQVQSSGTLGYHLSLLKLQAPHLEEQNYDYFTKIKRNSQDREELHCQYKIGNGVGPTRISFFI